MSSVPEPEGHPMVMPLTAAGSNTEGSDGINEALSNAPSGGEYSGMPTFENADFSEKPHGLPDSTADHPLVPQTQLASALGTGPPLVFDPKS